MSMVKEKAISIELALLTCSHAAGRLMEVGEVAAQRLLNALENTSGKTAVYSSTHGGTVAEITILKIMEKHGRVLVPGWTVADWFNDYFGLPNMATSDAVLMVVNGADDRMTLHEALYFSAN